MSKFTKKPINILGLVAVVALVIWQAYDKQSTGQVPTSKSVTSGEYMSVAQAHKQQLHDVQAQGAGKVISLLPDDEEGSRHQRILVREATGNSVLVVHNIDLAPRINDIQRGDTLQYFGEYVWNEKGGLIHWTHHDPNGRHVGGWIKHNGRIYE